MPEMERNEPSLVPEWLRSNGGGSSIHNSASSQADGPVVALPGRSRSSKSFSNADALRSPLLDRSSSSNFRRSSNSNGFSKHDKSSYSQSYSSFSRNHRDRDKGRSTITDTWDSKFYDPLRGMISGRVEDPLRRSNSLISRRPVDDPQIRVPSHIRNDGQNNHYNGNGTNSVVSNGTGIQKLSFEMDFPVLGSEDGPKTPELTRVSSPGFSRGIQSLSIANPPSAGSETWTSALAEVPSCPGSNSVSGSLTALQPATTTSASRSSSVPVPASTSPGLSMAEALAQAPVPAHNAPQLQKDEMALAQSKKLIPMTPLLPKTMVPTMSDKLKPIKSIRSTGNAVAPKNEVHHLSTLQPGSQPVRGASVRGDGGNSPSSGKHLLLKPGRENGVSPVLKDLLSATAIINNRVVNGQSTGNPSVTSGSSRISHNPKIFLGGRNTSGVDKRISRSNFFKLVREKSLNNSSSGPTVSGASVSSDVVDKLDKESKEAAGSQVTVAVTENELQSNGETCTVADSFSPSMEIDNEEERAFLLSLGWEDHAESDEEGLTEEEIYAFYRDEVMKQGPTSRLCRVLQAKVFSHLGPTSLHEGNIPSSQMEA